MAMMLLMTVLMNNTLIIKVLGEESSELNSKEEQLQLNEYGSSTGSAVVGSTTPQAIGVSGSTTSQAIKYNGEFHQILLWTEDEFLNLRNLMDFGEEFTDSENESEYTNILALFLDKAEEDTLNYFRKLLNIKIEEWLDIAEVDEEFENYLIESLAYFTGVDGLESLEIDGVNFKESFKLKIKSFVREKTKQVDLDNENFIELDRNKLLQLDYLSKNNGIYVGDINDDFLNNIYLKKIYDGVEDFLKSNWRDLHSKSFYKKLIIKVKQHQVEGAQLLQGMVLQDQNNGQVQNNQENQELGQVEIGQVLQVQEYGVSSCLMEEPVYMDTNVIITPIANSQHEGGNTNTEVNSNSSQNQNTEINSVQQALNAISNDMQSNLNAPSARYGVYADLNREDISGELLAKYQEIIDNRRGIVGWYYTGIHSEDYDHDTNTIENGSSLFKREELIALKLEERGSSFDIRKTLYGLYEEQLEKENSSPAYHRGIKRVKYKAFIYIPENGTYTFKAYFGSTEYDSDGDYEVVLKLKDLENNTYEISGYSGNWSADFLEGDIYQLEMDVRALNSDDHLPDIVSLKWSVDGVEEIIPNKYFILSENEELTSKTNLDIKRLDPIGDADKDGIPNSWETDGFVVLGNTIAKYDANIHVNKKVYYTSPVDKSTDGDPYSDLDEVIGANISGVSEVGKHPLIAAYPEIVAELQSISVNARMKNKFSQQTSTKTASLSVTKNTTVDKNVNKSSQVKGFMLGVKTDIFGGYSYKGANQGGRFEASLGITSEAKYEKTTDSENITTTISDITASNQKSRETLRSLSSDIDTFKSGDLTFAMRLKNIGSAAAYKVRPNVSLYIGSEGGSRADSFLTVQPQDLFMDIPAGGYSNSVNIETAQIDANRRIYLTVTKEIMEKLANGYPVSMELNNASSKAIINGTTKGNWEDYVNKINGITANIVHQDAVVGMKKYKVFAGDKNDTIRPQTTVGQALDNIYGNNFVIEDRTEDGVDNPKAYINNRPITNITITADDISELKELVANNSNATLNIFNMYVRPGMRIGIDTANSNQTKPIILNSIFKAGKISAYVIPNCSEIKEVKAKITYDGSTKVITLVKNSQNSILYEYEFENYMAIDIDGTNQVVAKDKNNNTTNIELYIAEEQKIKEERRREVFGMGYTDLDEDYHITSNAAAREFVRNNPADYYVMFKRHNYVPAGEGATRILSRWHLENFNRGWEFGYGLYIQGYFKAGGDNYNSIYNKKYKITLGKGQNSRNIDIFTGIDDATNYVLMVGNASQLNKEGGTHITVNGRRVEHAGHWAHEGQRLTSMIIVEADPDNPDLIRANIRNFTQLESTKYDIQVLGYFTEGKGDKYKKLDRDIHLGTFASNATSRIEKTINGTMFKPKAYMVVVDSPNGGRQRDTMLKINGIKFARGAHTQYSYRSYMIIPIGKDPNKVYIDVVNPNSNPLVNYNVKIIGYFY